MLEKEVISHVENDRTVRPLREPTRPENRIGALNSPVLIAGDDCCQLHAMEQA